MSIAEPNLPTATDAPLIAEGLFSFELGGSERVGADVALECKKRGYRVVCFAFYGSDGPIRRELESAGIECFDMNFLKRTRPFRRFTHRLALIRFFRRMHVDVVHIHHCTSLILGARAAHAAGVPRIVLTEHSIRELETMASYLAQSRRACRLADAVTVVHPSLEPFFSKSLRVSARKLRCVPNGVRLQKPDGLRRVKLRQELAVDAEEFLWMFAGRLASIKDLGTLIRAFKIAQSRSGKRLRLILVGSGDEETALKDLVRALAVANAISFIGPRSDVPSLLLAADGFVMSSLSEGLPMVLLEAMAARVPCVATAVGGIPALFSDGAGMLAPAASPEDLAQVMLAVAADPDLRQRISDTAFRKVAATNDLDRVVDMYLEAFELPSQWIVTA